MKLKIKAVLYSILEILAVLLGICLIFAGFFCLGFLLDSLVSWLKIFDYFSDKSYFCILFEVFLFCFVIVLLFVFLVVLFTEFYEENIERLESNSQNEEVGD